MTLNFNHINASEQLVLGSVTAPLLAPNAAVLSLHADANPNLTGNVQLVSGTNITLSQVGQAITINSTGGSLAPLTNTHIFVGNASNIATDVALSGDATIANTGALTLANTAVTAGSYNFANLTVDSKGRLTAASTNDLMVSNIQPSTNETITLHSCAIVGAYYQIAVGTTLTIGLGSYFFIL